MYWQANANTPLLNVPYRLRCFSFAQEKFKRSFRGFPSEVHGGASLKVEKAQFAA